MTWTPDNSKPGLTQSGEVRGIQTVPPRKLLRISSALTRPSHALRGAIYLLPAAALALAWATPAKAGDGAFLDELTSDAASENAKEAKETLDERRDSETRQQNRADQASRDDRSIEQRQEERERDEIKDAVTKAYLNADDGEQAAEDAADDAADDAVGRASAEDVARPGIKPDLPGGATEIQVGLGAYPGFEPDIFGAEVADSLGDQVLAPGLTDEAAGAQGDLGKYEGVPGFNRGGGTRLGAGYGGIFGSLAGIEAPSGSRSGAMQGSDGFEDDDFDDSDMLYVVEKDGETHVTTEPSSFDGGQVVNEFSAGELDVATGPNHDWRTDSESGGIKITKNDGSGGNEGVAESENSGSDEENSNDQETMVFGEEAKQATKNNGNSDPNDNSDSSEKSDNSENSDNSDNSDGADNSESSKEDGTGLPGKDNRGEPLTGEAAEIVDNVDNTEDDIKRAANNSKTTTPAEPDAEGGVDLDLPWSISRLPEKTTTPVRPGSMQQTATPLPLSFWNPGTIDPHRGN